MKTEPFLNNLWSIELVLEKYGSTTRVYPSDAIFIAFDLTKASEQLSLLQEHLDEIAGAEEQIKLLEQYFDDCIDRIDRDHDYRCEEEVFNIKDFLEATSITVSRALEQGYDKDYLCWPVDDRGSLKGCLKEYHIYKFYEKYMGEISGGVEKFLDLMLELQGPIQKARISGDFFWDRTDISFLHEYREAKRALSQKPSRPSIEV